MGRGFPKNAPPERELKAFRRFSPKLSPSLVPSPLLEAFETLLGAPDHTPQVVLNEAVRLTGEALHADRCFLCIRNPATRQSRIAFVWRRDETVPDVRPEHREWVDETPLPAEDPLYAAALAGRPSVYVDDVENAPPSVLNRDFEARTFGHRALIHAHIVEAGELWGILQPCVFDAPREWVESDRIFLEAFLPRLVPVVRAFVWGENPDDF